MTNSIFFTTKLPSPLSYVSKADIFLSFASLYDDAF